MTDGRRRALHTTPPQHSIVSPSPRRAAFLDTAYPDPVRAAGSMSAGITLTSIAAAQVRSEDKNRAADAGFQGIRSPAARRQGGSNTAVYCTLQTEKSPMADIK